MGETSEQADYPQWSNVYDCGKIFGTFRMARQISNVGLALAGLLLTFAWGTGLDFLWVTADRGVAEDAIAAYAAGGPGSAAYDEPKGDHGIHAVYARQVRIHLAQLLSAVIPYEGLGGVVAEIRSSVGGLCTATGWLIRNHLVFAILFFPVVLLIWSVAGGMICRSAAVQFARNESISLAEAFAFVRKKLWGGYFLAPVTPAVWVVIAGILLIIGGLFLSIPWLGDIVGGLLFVLALVGGATVAAALVGLAAGGGLLWPTVAVEATTSFDAFSTSFHYVFSRPWRSALYAVVAWAYGSVCWLVVSFLARLTLWATHTFVGIGTGLVTTREGIGSKLDALWSFELFGALHGWHREAVHSVEYVSFGLIGMWVYLVIVLVWAFVFSFFFCASTIIYFLLRRAVDLTDYEKIEDVEEYLGEEAPSDVTVPPAAEEAKPPAEEPTAPAVEPEPAPAPPAGEVPAAGDAPPGGEAPSPGDAPPDEDAPSPGDAPPAR